MKVPFYLSSWILIQTHRRFCGYHKASGGKKYKESDCTHVEEHLLFSMNISGGPGRDEAKLNCYSKSKKMCLRNLRKHLSVQKKYIFEWTFKLWSLNFGMNPVTVCVMSSCICMMKASHLNRRRHYGELKTVQLCSAAHPSTEYSTQRWKVGYCRQRNVLRT